MTTMCTAAANYLIRRTNEFNDVKGRAYYDQIVMTCKRLQKLLYFAEIVFMQQNNGERMFDDNFYAWPSGPVIPSVYNLFMQFQDGTMTPIDEEEHTPITEKMRNALDVVFERSVGFDTIDLVDFSHIENGPWANVYTETDINHKQIIDKSEMYSFYKDRDWVIEEKIAI